MKSYINDNWFFSENFSEKMLLDDYSFSDLIKVRIPHTVKEIPYNYFNENIYQMDSAYYKELMVPEEWKDKAIIITFEGVAHEAEVYINGKCICKHLCGYTAFSAYISDYIIYGDINKIVVKVDSRESLNIPPFGNVVDYLTYGGIYRDVYLEIKNKVNIEDIYISTPFDSELNEFRLKTEIKIKADMYSDELNDICITQDISSDKDREIMPVLQNIKTEYPDKWSEESRTIIIEYSTDNITKWDIDNPVLYKLKTRLHIGSEILEDDVNTFGFRTCEFKSEGFFLNGKKIKLRGLNRHQAYPYVGYAMPKSQQYLDADILKNELGLNCVRTSHYPQSQHFINRCDEIGLLVFTEIPGWQYLGDEEWKKQALVNVEEMVTQYRNHPSIILWGVRVNESDDDDELYEMTNELAKKLDSTRATGGVRYLKKSHLLEDVYTYNDFSHIGNNRGTDPKKKVTSDMNKAYLISEYNGHMYPTKAYDCEEHRQNHALRHANVLESVAADDNIVGAFGWCMADYNTHKDFGSGDKICYHGVLDMFRNKKLAAEVYASQQNKENILAVSSSMDIGEHPGSNIGDIYIFTNADGVYMYKNDEFIKEFKPDRHKYGHLEHPPIIVDDLIGELMEKHENMSTSVSEQVKSVLSEIQRKGINLGISFKNKLIILKLMLVNHFKIPYGVELYGKYIGNWGGNVTNYRFDAVKDGEIVKSVIRQPIEKVVINAKSDRDILIEDESYEVALIRIKAEDEFGNILNYYNGTLLLEAEGEIDIIGPKCISLSGGMGGTYVKTLGKSGTGILKISDCYDNSYEITFTVNVKRTEEVND